MLLCLPVDRTGDRCVHLRVHTRLSVAVYTCMDTGASFCIYLFITYRHLCPFPHPAVQLVVCLSVFLSMSPFIHLYTLLLLHLRNRPPTHASVYPFRSPPLSTPIHSSIPYPAHLHPPTSPRIRPSVRPAIHPPWHLSLYHAPASAGSVLPPGPLLSPFAAVRAPPAYPGSSPQAGCPCCRLTVFGISQSWVGSFRPAPPDWAVFT